MKIGIFGGSFDPIHTGHAIIAHHIISNGVVDRLWMMVSPLNPLKLNKKRQVADTDRLRMVEMVTRHLENVEPSAFEFTMPKPSYTIDTLNALQTKFPDDEFYLVIGGDNWEVFDKWRNSEEILAVLSAKISEVAGSLDALGGLAAMKDAIAKIDMNAIIREVNDTVNVVVDECVRRFSLEESSVKLVMDYSHTFERQLVKDAIGEEAAKNFPNGFDDLLRFPKVVGDEKVVAAIGKARTYIAAYLNEAFKYCNDKSTTTFTLETTFRKSTVACIAEVKKNKAIWKNGLEAALKAAAKELK